MALWGGVGCGTCSGVHLRRAHSRLSDASTPWRFTTGTKPLPPLGLLVTLESLIVLHYGTIVTIVPATLPITVTHVFGLVVPNDRVILFVVAAGAFTRVVGSLSLYGLWSRDHRGRGKPRRGSHTGHIAQRNCGCQLGLGFSHSGGWPAFLLHRFSSCRCRRSRHLCSHRSPQLRSRGSDRFR